jgi:nitrogen fixation protein NifU and related proteins
MVTKLTLVAAVSDYNELYQQVILEHNKKPRNFTVLEDANAYALGKNPLCGDQFAVYVKLGEDGETLESISFQGSGCAIAKASASLMTTFIKGKTKTDAMTLRDDFQQMVTGQMDAETEKTRLGRLSILSGVKDYPVRVKCATLAWHTMAAALQGQQDSVSTE